MSTARQAKSTGPARLTDIIVRCKFPAKPAGRKPGDLTTDAAASTGQAVAPTQNEADPLTHAPVTRVVTVARQQPETPNLEHSPTVPGRSDVFNFKRLGGDDLDIVSPTAGDSELVLRPSPAPILFHGAEGVGESSSEQSSVEAIPPSPSSVTAAVTIDSGSSATDWCLIEQYHPVRASPVSDAEVRPMRVAAAGDLVIISDPRGYSHESHVTDRATLPQIITMAMGVLLIIAGVAMVSTPMWYEAHLRVASDAIRSDDFRAKLPVEGGWFGLAFILVGATLEIIGLRTRKITYRV